MRQGHLLQVDSRPLYFMLYEDMIIRILTPMQAAAVGEWVRWVRYSLPLLALVGLPTAGEELGVRHQYSTLRPLLWRLHHR